MPQRIHIVRLLAGVFCLAMLFSACSSLDASNPVPTETSTAKPSPTTIITVTPIPTLPVPNVFRQSPSLDDSEKDGTLPAVLQRLPLNPKVVRTVNELGNYGGTWRMVIPAASGQELFVRTVAYEPLVRWTTDWSGIEPNLAESYTVNANATEYTFKLREGIHWSDGEFFTTEDIAFWYKDVLLNSELTPIIPPWLKAHNELGEFQFIDRYTFKVHFASPNSLFLQYLASPDGLMLTSFPAHYAEKFHWKYLTQDALSKLLNEGGFTTWSEMFKQRIGVAPLDRGNFTDPARPRLSAWVLKSPYSAGASLVVWERNPYYWKIDPVGNQLPYIDTVIFKVVQNRDEAINAALAGDVNMQNLSDLGIDVEHTFETLKDGPYQTYPIGNATNNVMTIQLNLVNGDAEKRNIFLNKDFRIGLSYAIDRQEILKMIYHGEGKPWQAAPGEDSPFYDPQMGTQYTEYNVEKANDYLDRSGYKKDQMGKRLGPNGSPISFTVEVLETEPQQIAMLNLVAKYWAAVGINMQPKLESRPIFLATVRSNLHDAAAWRGGTSRLNDVLLDPSNYLPSTDNSFWAVTWANAYNRVPGYENIQLQNAIGTSMDMYDRVRSTTNINEQLRLMKGALLLTREAFWVIGIAQGPQQYGLARNTFRNLAPNMPSSWIYPDPAPGNPEQFFIVE